MNNAKDCAIQLVFLICSGREVGRPGSLSGSRFCLKTSANCSIRWEDSNIASADKSSNVTKSTKKNKHKNLK